VQCWQGPSRAAHGQGRSCAQGTSGHGPPSTCRGCAGLAGGGPSVRPSGRGAPHLRMLQLLRDAKFDIAAALAGPVAQPATLLCSTGSSRAAKTAGASRTARTAQACQAANVASSGMPCKQ